MSQFRNQVRKGANRAQFEADKLMRLNRARSESERTKRRINEKIVALGTEALEVALQGETLSPSLQAIVDEIKQLQQDLEQSQEEMHAIKAEEWVPPPPAPAQPPRPRPTIVEITPDAED